MTYHIALVFLPLVLGMLSGLSVKSKKNGWYDTLQKPQWTPPKNAYGPVWTVLYLLMGIALYRIVENGKAPPYVLYVFAAQLLLNLVWTPVFFGAQNPRLALWIIGGLLVTSFTTLVQFWKIDAVAGWLLVPYFAWLLVAGNINREIVLKNP